MNTRTTLIITLIFGLTFPLFARIGETPEECVQRYGATLKGTPSKHGFWDSEQRHEKNGVRISIRFLRGQDGVLHAEYLEYQPVNRSEFKLSPERTKSLMDIVSTNWVTLTLIPLPPTPTNAAPDTAKILTRTSKVKVITMEKTGGIEEQRLQKEAEERKALRDSIESRNREVRRIKERLGAIARPGIPCWEVPHEAYAAGNDSTLVIFSQAYMKAYEKHVETSTAPLQGF